MSGNFSVPPLALYVHLPWCPRKCPYCDFNSHAATEIPEEEYLRALLTDLGAECRRVGERVIETVFLGGGTPSLFAASSIAALLEGIASRARLAPDCEITLEANPGTLDRERFADYRQAGVNRLSVGVQSFCDAALERIGRVHDARAARRALETAHAVGFENVNVDLMYGLPGQSCREAVADVEVAIEHAPAHISHYELSIEPNTLFHRFPPELPGEDAMASMQERCHQRLLASGYHRYEVSAFAKPGARCRHNVNYWCYGDYLGIGAGAHGKLSDPGRAIVERSIKHRHPRRYMQALVHGEFELKRVPVVPAELPLEFMLNAARLLDGIPQALFEAHTGLTLAAIAPLLREAEERGLMERVRGTIRPTPRGTRFLNDLLIVFMGEDERGTLPVGHGKRAPVDRGGGLPVL